MAGEGSPGFLARLLASLATAALLSLSQPGPDLGGLVFVALVPWAAVNLAPPAPRAWVADYAGGLLFFGASAGWLAHVHAVAALLVIPVAALSFVVAGALLRRIGGGVPAALALPLAWLAGEWLRAICPPGGFPMGQLGAGLYRAKAWIQVADLGGAWLVAFLAACVNGAFADLAAAGLGLRPISKGRVWIALALGATAGVGPLLYGAARGRAETSAGPVVTVVQANIPQEYKEAVQGGEDEGGRRAREMFEKHLALTESVADPGDLLVWAETMFPATLGAGGPGDVYVEAGAPGGPYGFDEAREIEDMLVRRTVLAPRWAGMPHFLFGDLFYDRAEEGFRLFNSALLYSPGGERRAAYHKVHLVPGGEYLPWRRAIPLADAIGKWIESWAGYFPDIAPGAGPKVFPLPARGGRTWRFGVGICWDNAYPDLFRANANAGAEFHVVLSNEAHFLDSFEMEQLLAHTVFRAIETRRAVLRATNTGISALVSPCGEILAVLERGGRRKEVGGTLRVTVPIATGSTLYARIGEVVPVSATLLAALLAGLRTLRSRRRRLSEPLGTP